jgi:hypothetical protein
MSWKPEVIADSTGKWHGNELRFATRKEADDYVYDLSARWTSVRGWRTIETDDPVTYRMVNGRAVPLEPQADHDRV